MATFTKDFSALMNSRDNAISRFRNGNYLYGNVCDDDDEINRFLTFKYNLVDSVHAAHAIHTFKEALNGQYNAFYCKSESDNTGFIINSFGDLCIVWCKAEDAYYKECYMRVCQK
jgi:hypothetical protein